MESESTKTDCFSCVAVYCGAQQGKNKLFGQRAEELGTCLASKKISVVYGGGRFGIMGKMADSVLAHQGKLTGIIPKFFTEYEGYTSGGEEIIVPDMHTRKKMIFDMAQGFIALPGGVGTLEELTEVITWSKLNLHHKPIAVLNVAGYYDHFLSWLQRGIDEGLIPNESSDVSDTVLVSQDPRTLVDMMCEKWQTSTAQQHTTQSNSLDH